MSDLECDKRVVSKLSFTFSLFLKVFKTKKNIFIFLFLSKDTK